MSNISTENPLAWFNCRDLNAISGSCCNACSFLQEQRSTEMKTKSKGFKLYNLNSKIRLIRFCNANTFQMFIFASKFGFMMPSHQKLKGNLVQIQSCSRNCKLKGLLLFFKSHCPPFADGKANSKTQVRRPANFNIEVKLSG